MSRWNALTDETLRARDDKGAHIGTSMMRWLDAKVERDAAAAACYAFASMQTTPPAVYEFACKWREEAARRFFDAEAALAAAGR